MKSSWMDGRVVLALVLGVFLCGCGTGAYESTMVDTLKRLRREAPFAQLTTPVDLLQPSVLIRVPNVLKNRLVEKPMGDSDWVDPQRLQPPFMKLPGFKCSYENFGKAGSEEIAYYCYLATVPTTAPEAATLPNDIIAAIKKEFPNWNGTWQDISVDTPAGEKSAWQYVSVEGPMFFDTQVPGADKAEFKKLQAKFELWLKDGEHDRVLVGWRISDELEKQVGLLKMAPVTAGSISFGPPPAPAAEGKEAEGAKQE